MSKKSNKSTLPVWAFALATTLTACGGGSPALVATKAPPPRAAKPPAEVLPKDAIRQADSKVIDELHVALEASGHDCEDPVGEHGVMICDRKTAGVPTFVVLYLKPQLFLASNYYRKNNTSCADVLPKLNELNVGLDGLKVVCAKNRITFTSSTVVPSYGLSPEDVQAQAASFRRTVQLVISTSGLRAFLGAGPLAVPTASTEGKKRDLATLSR